MKAPRPFEYRYTDGRNPQHVRSCFVLPLSVFQPQKFGGIVNLLLLCGEKTSIMGQLAFIKMFILIAISSDKNDNRRHVHVFRKGLRHQHSLAKIWIEADGEKCIEIAYSELSSKDNEMIMTAIDHHWSFINEQITKTFRGEKTIAIDLNK